MLTPIPTRLQSQAQEAHQGQPSISLQQGPTSCPQRKPVSWRSEHCLSFLAPLQLGGSCPGPRGCLAPLAGRTRPPEFWLKAWATHSTSLPRRPRNEAVPQEEQDAATLSSRAGRGSSRGALWGAEAAGGRPGPEPPPCCTPRPSPDWRGAGEPEGSPLWPGGGQPNLPWPAPKCPASGEGLGGGGKKDPVAAPGGGLGAALAADPAAVPPPRCPPATAPSPCSKSRPGARLHLPPAPFTSRRSHASLPEGRPGSAPTRSPSLGGGACPAVNPPRASRPPAEGAAEGARGGGFPLRRTPAFRC